MQITPKNQKNGANIWINTDIQQYTKREKRKKVL